MSPTVAEAGFGRSKDRPYDSAQASLISIIRHSPFTEAEPEAGSLTNGRPPALPQQLIETCCPRTSERRVHPARQASLKATASPSCRPRLEGTQPIPIAPAPEQGAGCPAAGSAAAEKAPSAVAILDAPRYIASITLVVLYEARETQLGLGAVGAVTSHLRHTTDWLTFASLAGSRQGIRWLRRLIWHITLRASHKCCDKQAQNED